MRGAATGGAATARPEEEPAATSGATAAVPKRALFAWCLYDWANSGFPTVITTYVFSAYFAKTVAATEVEGTSLWAYAISAAGLAVAFGSPILGAIADQAGRRKPWVAVFSLLCIAASFALWWVVPGAGRTAFALVVVGVGYFAFDAMEAHLAGHEFLAADSYTIADIALFAYTHVAHEGGFDMSGYPGIAAWVARVAAQPRHVPITA